LFISYIGFLHEQLTTKPEKKGEHGLRLSFAHKIDEIGLITGPEAVVDVHHRISSSRLKIR
jgi:hypothetical protein